MWEGGTGYATWHAGESCTWPTGIPSLAWHTCGEPMFNRQQHQKCDPGPKKDAKTVWSRPSTCTWPIRVSLQPRSRCREHTRPPCTQDRPLVAYLHILTMSCTQRRKEKRQGAWVAMRKVVGFIDMHTGEQRGEAAMHKATSAALRNSTSFQD